MEKFFKDAEEQLTASNDKTTPSTDYLNVKTADHDTTGAYTGITYSIAEVWTQGGMSFSNRETSIVRSFWAERYPKGYNDCSLFNIICVSVLPCMLCVGGLIGNALTMLIFWQDRQKSSMYVLLLQLAVVDSLLLVIWSTLCVFWVIEYFTENPPTLATMFAPYMHKYGWPSANLIQLIAIWLIVFISMQRYVAVCHPHKMRLLGTVKVAWIQLALLVTFAILYSVPKYMQVYIISHENGEIELKESWLVADPKFHLWYGLTTYMIYFIIPFVMLIFFTISLIHQLRILKRKLKLTQPSAIAGTSSERGTIVPSSTYADTAASERAKNQRKEKSITLSLIVVVIIFLICQSNNPMRQLLEYLLTPEQKVCGTPYSYSESLTATWLLINSSVNFVVFCLCSKGFRQQVLHRLCGKNQMSAIRTIKITSAKQHCNI